MTETETVGAGVGPGAEPVKKGDRFWAMGTDVEVRRVGDGWADIKVRQVGGAEWTKRQPLPFPEDWERQPAATGGAGWEPNWTIHPGVMWRELVNESDLSQVQIAERMGISQKHLSQILTCSAMPGVEITVAFARVLDVPPRLLWQFACDYRLALALGKRDFTAEHL